jgi:hypothetical protein
MAFGRMNPPTIGHQKLVEKIKSIPGDHYVFLSQSQKPQTDPLTFTDKLRYAKFFFPSVTVGHPEVKTIIQAMQKLSELGYERVIYVAGSDRVDSFTKLLNQYNGQADKAGNVPYSFKSIQVVSAGERNAIIVEVLLGPYEFFIFSLCVLSWEEVSASGYGPELVSKR